MVWCLNRVMVKTSPGRQRYSGLGAVDSHSHGLVSIRTRDNINASRLIALLEAIRAKHPGTAVTLIMDDARYQRCRVVRDHAERLGIELLFLPPYSPNLILIERLWKLTKRRCLTNRYHRDLESFRQAIDRCLDDLAGRLKPEMQRLLTLNFQFFGFQES
jgi:transposase